MNSNFEIEKICSFLNVKFNEKLKEPTIFGNQWYSNSSSQERNNKIFTTSLYDFKNILSDTEKKYINLKFKEVFEILYPEITLKKERINFIKLFVHCLNEFKMNTQNDWKIYFRFLIMLKSIYKL